MVLNPKELIWNAKNWYEVHLRYVGVKYGVIFWIYKRKGYESTTKVQNGRVLLLSDRKKIKYLKFGVGVTPRAEKFVRIGNSKSFHIWAQQG